MINVIWGTTRKPVSSQQLAEYIQNNKPDLDGELYIGYPIIAAPEGAYPIDALLISREKGLVIFSLVEGTRLDDYDAAQDESANRLETKLRGYRELMRGRKLLAAPEVITFAPAAQIAGREVPGYPLCNMDSIGAAIDELSWDYPELLESALSVIQSISTIRKGKRRRDIQKPDSRGAKLKSLEDSIANLDNIQGRAVIETVEGVQRVRGLAGSGKTIVLALKAAYLHTQHPEWRIAVTFNTRSLKEQFRRLINTFVIEQAGEEPVWSHISVLNAWGAPGAPARSGLYYQFAKAHGLEYTDFQAARRKYSYDGAFAGVCSEALMATSTKKEKHLYDVILIDEAQDFSPPFFQMCYSMLSEKKRLVYAYDELQSLTDSSLPPPEELFGKKADGTPRVIFNAPTPGQAQQDIILEKCYRNSRPVLATAHALGFGIYRKPDEKTGTGLIQMFDQSKLWLDVGYRVEAGALEDGQEVTLSRPPETSPTFLESHSDVDDLIQFVHFETKEQQAEWLAAQIQKNLKEDELDADDIIVINPDPLSTRAEVGKPRRLLFERDIETHLAGVDVSADVFFDQRNESVAFTGIFRAKGNEAGMVYIMNAQNCASSFGNLARVRNQLFTAITRSKSWVRVVGVGDGMRALIDEYEALKASGYKLHFTYPTPEVRKTMNIINRDMTEAEKQAAKDSSRQLSKLIEDVEAGRVMIEDLPPKVTERLRAIFGGGD
ncbi:DEAD/DEAH box helicase [Vannielia sp. SX4]|uniref:DEAD/DEAH box helicase n=1 Tax=Vannielia sp. SX4 TaxID=3463852 RepID=UPI0040586DD4